MPRPEPRAPSPHSPPQRSPARLAVARLALAIGGIALLSGAAELITRWVAPHVPFLVFPSPGNCLRRSASLSVDFRPDCEGVLSATAFRTNAQGLRGPALRDDGRRRILALGDSCTWGW